MLKSKKVKIGLFSVAAAKSSLLIHLLIPPNPSPASQGKSYSIPLVLSRDVQIMHDPKVVKGSWLMIADFFLGGHLEDNKQLVLLVQFKKEKPEVREIG